MFDGRNVTVRAGNAEKCSRPPRIVGPFHKSNGTQLTHIPIKIMGDSNQNRMNEWHGNWQRIWNARTRSWRQSNPSCRLSQKKLERANAKKHPSGEKRRETGPRGESRWIGDEKVAGGGGRESRAFRLLNRGEEKEVMQLITRRPIQSGPLDPLRGSEGRACGGIAVSRAEFRALSFWELEKVLTLPGWSGHAMSLGLIHTRSTSQFLPAPSLSLTMVFWCQVGNCLKYEERWWKRSKWQPEHTKKGSRLGRSCIHIRELITDRHHYKGSSSKCITFTIRNQT